MSNETVTALEEIEAPYGRRVTLEGVEHDNGLRLLRIHIREGSRFTVLDVDEETAIRWSAVMSTWAGGTRH